MQTTFGLFDVPEDIEPVIDRMWGAPDVYLHFDHPEFLVYIHYDPGIFEYPEPWVKALKLSSGSTEGDILKSPISSSSLAACIRTDDPVYDYTIVDGEPPLTPDSSGDIRFS
jgi:hypothetical protein